MPRLVWFALNDGRSVVAGCGTTDDAFAQLLTQPDRTIALAADDAVDFISSSSVRAFAVVDARTAVPPATSTYRFAYL